MPNANELPEVTEEQAKPSDNPIDRMIDIAIEAQDGPTSKEPAAETTSGEEQKPDVSKEGAAPADKKDSDSGASDDKSQQQPDKKGAEEKKQVAGPKDLTLQDGTVVKSGAERRFYEQREVARQEARTYKTQAEQARTELQRVQGELNTLKQTTSDLHGTDPNTIKIGVQIVKDLQRDPEGTMKKLLAEVVALGYTVEGIGRGVDQLAMQRMIDARMPTQSAQLTDEQILAEAQQEVNSFYAANPDARPHDALLGRMMRDHPGLDLQTAYFELKNAFVEKGFDFSRTLEQNLADASTDDTQQPTSQQQPMLNGRAPTDTGIKPADEVKVAHEDTSTDDIVKAAMREAGMNIN